MQGGTFGAAVDAKDNVWLSSYGGKSIAVFDKNGKPLTPPEGITFDGKLGLMQGIIVTPSGDVWVARCLEAPIRLLPQGRLDPGQHCLRRRQRRAVQIIHGSVPPRHRPAGSDLGLGQLRNHVFALPGIRSEPKSIASRSASTTAVLNIDSLGNVWVTNRFGAGLLGMAHLVDMAVHLKREGVESAADYLTKTMSKQKGGGDGSVTLLRPDGTEFPGSPFKGGGLPGPWAVVVDGNDNVWISNFAMPEQSDHAAVRRRTENCPPGMKTGDQISPPGGYVGGGLQMQTDLAISPSGDVWVMNNWQDIDSCFGTPTKRFQPAAEDRRGGLLSAWLSRFSHRRSGRPRAIEVGGRGGD